MVSFALLLHVVFSIVEAVSSLPLLGCTYCLRYVLLQPTTAGLPIFYFFLPYH